jgi:trimethylamine--corrinoid protein Co-methyltransferase
LAQQTAEILSGIVISQCVNPGAPLWFGTCAGAMDMRNGLIALGGIEGALINIAHAQLADYYGLPSRGTGCNTESKILDMQAGYEKGITLFLSALAKNNMVFYPGTIEHALTVDFKSLVIDHEIIGMLVRALDGINVNSKTLALDVIAKVGSDGHFLGERHTLANLSKEIFVPHIMDRKTREEWIESGSLDAEKRAQKQAMMILDSHKPYALDKDIEENLQAYIREVEERQKIEGNEKAG